MVAVAVAYPLVIILGGVVLVYLNPPSLEKTDAFLGASLSVSSALLVTIFFVAVLYLDKVRDKPRGKREFMAWWFILGLVVVSTSLFIPTFGPLLGLDRSLGPGLIAGTVFTWGFVIFLLAFGILQLGRTSPSSGSASVDRVEPPTPSSEHAADQTSVPAPLRPPG
jgi:hypothetical protein